MRDRPPALSVVIPAFNEGRRIAMTLDILLAELPRIVRDYEIRVVDDGSGDETAAVVERIAAGQPEVVLQREPHRGKGAAVKAGLLAARGELRFMCDADLSMPIHELNRFLAIVPDHADIAIGTREGIGARRIDEPLYRHLLGRAFNTAVRTLVLPGFDDTQCGFKLFTARAVETILPAVTLAGWAFDVEMLFVARLRGLTVREVPIEWHYRELSRVSTVRDPLRMLRDLCRIRINAVRVVYAQPASSDAARRIIG